MNASVGTVCTSSDQVLEQLLDEITDRIQAGEPVDLDAMVAGHPEYAERLQRLLPAMQVLMAFGCSQSATASSSVVPGSLDSVVRGSPDPAHSASNIQHPASSTLGDFRIVREIGRGGMGVVYEAEQISIGRPVALKVLPFASILDERRLARFRNEVRAAGQLHHTNIVPVFAVGSDRGVHFYAMQLVEGQSLAQVIEQVGAASRAALPNDSNNWPRMSRSARGTYKQDTAPVAALSTLRTTNSTAFFRTVAQLAIQAAEALEHAHTSGVIHRDIKPSNLLVDARGCLWLTDFGLARIESDTDLTMTGDLLGTLRYMSPEQTLGSRVVLDHRTDIYSLGATLYELLALRPAFDAADRPALLRQINEQEPPTPRRINHSIPADLETIVLKAMAKEPAARYATAQHLADDLNRFLERKPIHARRPTLVECAGKWARRHIALISITSAAMAIVTLACMAAALLTLRAYRSEAQHRIAAVDNLRIASRSIDRLLARVADDRYNRGDLSHAETLAGDATQFYEELLKHSEDTELRFRAAEAHTNLASVWHLLGQHEKARAASLRSLELIRPLIVAFPDDGKYLNVRGGADLALSQAEWGFDGSTNAQEPSVQAAADYRFLVERFPHEPKYRGSLANALSNIGMIYWTRGGLDEADRYFKESIEIRDRVPDTTANTPEFLTTKAGTLCNWSMVARERGDHKRAMELLDEASAIQKRSLEQWPTNPVATFTLFNNYWHIAETSIQAGQHQAAAKAVDTLVWAFPDELRAYSYGAEQLLQCAELAEKEGTGSSLTSGANSAKPDDSSSAADGSAAANAYRRRARQLIAVAHDAPDRTPDTTERFAWFLVTCADESMRDPRRALELATAIAREVPQRADPWLTLALAHYRLGDWQAADDAVQNALKLPHQAAKMRVCDWLVLAMIRHQQGRADEARQWHKRVRHWLANDDTDEHDILRLAAEANQLLDAIPAVSTSLTERNQ